MKFPIEKQISNFVASQFPAFYRDEGPNFILFLQAYYEWLESSGQPVGEARNLFDYRDIDNTLEEFLLHFQKKYLYGIPFDVIINKRFLLKHVLDVYRSKGSIQCYKLLFKLLYNQDVEIYLPREDILKPSNGNWVEPKFLEVNDNGNLQDYVGKTIIGLTTGTSAVVESYVREVVNFGSVSSLYISNLKPHGGAFIEGEKIIIQNQGSTTDITNAPVVLGSLNSLDILNGGQGFNVGDILKIVHYDISNNALVSYGRGGYVKVTGIDRKYGSVNFFITQPGFGFNGNSQIFIYNNATDTTGTGASFQIGAFSYIQNITYNTDLICDYLTKPLNSTTFGFPGNTSANLSSVIGTTLSYTSQNFGSIASLDNISSGNNYTAPLNIFVRSTIESNNLQGNVSFTNTSTTVTGTNTLFQAFFTNGSIITLVTNSTFKEQQVILSVNSNTSLTLYGNPTGSNTAGKHRVDSVILPSNFLPNSPIMYRVDGQINGINDLISGIPSSGNNIVSSTIAVDSGIGYIQGETIKAYKYNAINIPTILNAGANYSNGDTLTFIGGSPTSFASGYITTNGSGGITVVVLNNSGSGYNSVPSIMINTKTGNGAILSTSIKEYNTTSFVQGNIRKAGVGIHKGYWNSTKGFLNADKYIQDSYFYQDYSYQIKVATTLDKYKNILYDTFHVAGSELFGEFLLINEDSLNLNTLDYAFFEPRTYLTSDISNVTSDSTLYTVDEVAVVDFTTDSTNTRVDSSILTADQVYY
jgi:hypothetical protein